VHRSWQPIVLMGDAATQMFYRRLFAIDPSTHALFSDTDMAEQRVKFMDTFDLFVRNIGDLEKNLPMLEERGRRQAELGVENHHYDGQRSAHFQDTVVAWDNYWKTKRTKPGKWRMTGSPAQCGRLRSLTSQSGKARDIQNANT